jgi:ABC-type Mn2+/Zn2+ transport system ATPase subunit
MAIIDCKDLVLGYQEPLNNPLNLNISENKWLGIIGENGIGKSTFLKTILGEIKPLAGELRVMGQTLGKSNALISYIPQLREINLSERMSGLSLIKSSYLGWKFGIPFFSKKLHQEVLRLITLVGASKYMLQPFSTLSGGQKKRIYLAQALINKPKLLLLDEPLADLDQKARQHFIQALKEIHQVQELSMLIISHDMHEIAEYLDGFIHFKDGYIHYCNEVPCVKKDVYVGV